MSSRTSGGAVDSTYFLSEFAKEYLDKYHPIARTQRSLFLQRNQELKDHGAAFSVEMAASPYDGNTVTIRGVEDAPVARLLKRAIASTTDEDALQLCAEAQKLAPHYGEAYRVEGDIRARMLDDSAALAAYERALTVSDMASTRYHFGSYLLDEAIDVRRALEVLQEGARIDRLSPELAAQIAWAQYLLRDWSLAMGAAKAVLDLPRATFVQRATAVIIALRAANHKVEHEFSCDRLDVALEYAEEAIALAEDAGLDCIVGEGADLLLLLRSTLTATLPKLKGYLAISGKRCIERASLLEQDSNCGRQRILSHVARLVPDKGFGFVSAVPEDYFLHVYELTDRDLWDSLQVGERCAFEPMQVGGRWRATNVRVLRL